MKADEGGPSELHMGLGSGVGVEGDRGGHKLQHL